MNTQKFSALPCRAAATLSLVGVFATAVQAQQVNTSAAAAGMGDNYIARASGSDAVAWNPANLGLSGNPGFSLQLLSVGGNTGLHPVDLSDFAKWDNKPIPAATREEWLQSVASKNGEKGTGDLGLGYIGASFGHVALQASTVVSGSANLNSDAMEAILFGNAGRTGAIKSFNFAGSNMKAGAFTTVAGSYGMSIGQQGTGKGGHEMSLGVTAKYVMGNVVMLAQDNGSTTDSNSVKLNFPVVLSDPSNSISAGNGVGIDLGFGWRSQGTTVGVTVMNAVNSFKWDESKLESRPGTSTFDINTHTTNFDSASFSTAPASLRKAIEDQKFKPTIAAGFSRDVTSMVTITGDARQQLGNDASILIGPKTQVGVGAELRVIPMLPLRGGVSYVTGGVGFSGGVGLHVLGFEVGLAGSVRSIDSGTQAGFLVSVINIH